MKKHINDVFVFILILLFLPLFGNPKEYFQTSKLDITTLFSFVLTIIYIACVIAAVFWELKKPSMSDISPDGWLSIFFKWSSIIIRVCYLISLPMLYFMIVMSWGALSDSSGEAGDLSSQLLLSSFIMIFIACVVSAIGYGIVAKIGKFLFLAAGLIFISSLALMGTEEKNKNFAECQIKRGDIFCYETKTEFHCGPSESDTYSISLSYPKSPDCPFIEDSIRKAQNLEKYESSKKKLKDNLQYMNYIAISRFEEIVLEIINSDNPKSLSFEKDLMSINNCYKNIITLQLAHPSEYKSAVPNANYGPNVTHGTLRQVLNNADPNKFNTNLNKYYDYLQAHGRSVKEGMPYSALPEGPKELGCDTISKF